MKKQNHCLSKFQIYLLNLKTNIVFIFFIIFCSGSVYAQQLPLWESKSPDFKLWTEHVNTEIQTLGAKLVQTTPKDYAAYCPNYKNLNLLQREEFWIFLLSAMVRYESNFNTNATYKENFKDSKGKYIISRGLLQLSIESSRAYACGFNNEAEIHDPLRNLSCGLRILNKWVGQDLYIGSRVHSKWRGGSRYWSVLRSNGSPYKSITKLTKELNICKI